MPTLRVSRAFLAAIALCGCGAGLSRLEPGAATPVASKDAFEIEVRHGWPMVGCPQAAEVRYFVDLARHRLRFHPSCQDRPLDPNESEHETVLSDADREAIAKLASAMLRAPDRDDRSATIGCLNVTDGDNTTVTVTHHNGRREQYGCAAPPGAIAIREADFTALMGRLNALLPCRPNANCKAAPSP